VQMVFLAVVHVEDIEQFSSWFLLLVFNKDNLLFGRLYINMMPIQSVFIITEQK
jgi:hypothetical protein